MQATNKWEPWYMGKESTNTQSALGSKEMPNHRGEFIFRFSL